MNTTRFEYRGINVVIGKSPMYNLWRASIGGKQIPNTFFKSFHEAETHCKTVIDERAKGIANYRRIWAHFKESIRNEHDTQN
jgi:hypothetical protein